MGKKVFVGFIVVYLVAMILDYLIWEIFLDRYMGETAHLWRVEMINWIYFVVGIFFAYFFTLIFYKGYEARGIMEGVRYGLYVGLMMALPAAYSTYASMDIPYYFAFWWFVLWTFQLILLGILLAMIFKGESAKGVKT